MPATLKNHESSALGLVLMLAVSLGIMLFEYLQILNIFDASRWVVGCVPIGGLLVTGALSLFFKNNTPFNLPFLAAHFLGAAGLLFWAIEWWNTSTRHRTEYFDTHVSYFLMLFAVSMHSTYKYVDSKRRKTDWTPAELAELYSQITVLVHEPLFEPKGEVENPNDKTPPPRRLSEVVGVTVEKLEIA